MSPGGGGGGSTTGADVLPIIGMCDIAKAIGVPCTLPLKGAVDAAPSILHPRDVAIENHQIKVLAVFTWGVLSVNAERLSKAYIGWGASHRVS